MEGQVNGKGKGESGVDLTDSESCGVVDGINNEKERDLADLKFPKTWEKATGPELFRDMTDLEEVLSFCLALKSSRAETKRENLGDLSLEVPES